MQCPINTELFVWSSSRDIFVCTSIENRFNSVKPGVLCVQCELYIADRRKGRVADPIFRLQIKSSLFNIKSVSVNLMRISPTTLISQRVKGYCRESNTLLYKWRVTWNYACSPFKEEFKIKSHVTVSQFLFSLKHIFV